MPHTDKFGVAAPLEFIRQWLEQGGYFDVFVSGTGGSGGKGGAESSGAAAGGSSSSTGQAASSSGAGGGGSGASVGMKYPEWKTVADCSLLAACGPVTGMSTSGSGNGAAPILSSRLLKNFW